MFLSEVEVVMQVCQNDDVAERDGWARGQEQRLDEVDGDRPQGEEASRFRRWIRSGSSSQPVSADIFDKMPFAFH